MSWLLSRALVEEYSEESSSAGAPFVRSKLIAMQQGTLRRAKTTDASNHSLYGTTYERSTGGPGGALLTWFREDFLAKISPPPETEQASQEREADSGKSLLGSFAKFDPDSRSWKTHQFSLLEGLESFLGTWPQWGMMRGGACWEQTMLVRRTEENESGFWPTIRSTDGQRGGRGDLIQAVRGNPNSHYNMWQTPVADDAVERAMGKFNSRGEPKLSAQVKQWPTPHGFSKDGKSNGPSGNELGRAVNRDMIPTPTVKGNYNKKGLSAKSGDGLATFVAKFPTPRAGSKSGGGKGLDGGTGSRESLEKNHGYEAMKELTGGSLNPAWVEWLMGWPIGWTDCAASGTGKFQRWQQQHGEYFQETK